MVGQFTNRLDFRTNISASINMQKLIQEPPPNFATRINWWQVWTIAESGDWDVSDEMLLMEGPTPDNMSSDGRSFGLNQTRDQRSFRVVVIAHPTGGSSTLEISGDSDAGGRSANGLYTYPGGIWSVEEWWAGARVDTGIKRMSFSVGFEHIKLTRDEYQWAKRQGWNSIEVGALMS